MKGEHPKIVLLGNNSGNNLGDAAIMSGIMDVVSKELPDAEYFIPSIKPSFINDNYSETYKVKGINVMPWTGSIRLFGIPTFYHMAKSDIAMICDGIIFGKKFFNPAFNFLITLLFLVPWAKITNCKLVCYSCGIGPFPVPFSKWAAKVVMNASDLVILRENDSKDLAIELGVTKPITVTGDAAFLNPVSSEKRAKDILKREGINANKPMLGINITKYIDSWLKGSERVADKNVFLETLSSSFITAIKEINEDIQPIIFSTHPMDETVCYKLAKKINGTVIDNTNYLSHDIQAVMRECGLLIGMRFHSLVLSTAVGCPIIGLIYAPKVKGFMRLLGYEELGIELSQIEEKEFANTIIKTWKNRKDIQSKQQVLIDELKAGARQAAVTLRERYFQDSQIEEKAVSAV